VTTVSLPGTPVISSIAVSWLKSFSATIGWATDVPGDSQVEYGPTTAYGSMTSIDATQTITHTRNLGGLSGGTLYHFRVRSRDLAGHLGVSADQVLTTVLDVDIGRMAHLRLDEKSGTIAADASGSGNAGTLLNGPVWIAGKSLGALSFDGVNDFVRIPHQASLDLYPMSISLWMRTGDAGTRGLVSKYVSGSLNGYQLFLKSGGICGSFFKSASRYVGDGTGCAVAAPGAFNDNLWHHLALVVDSGGGRIYVDGTLRDSKPWSGSPGLPTTTQDVWLGRHPSSLQPYLAGALDDVRIYGRGLSPVEVGALAGSPTPSGTPPLISGVTVSGISPSGATVSWLTNEPSDTLVEFGPSTSYGSMTPWSGAMVTVHGASLASLSASALYHYRVYSRDAAGTLAVSGDATFMTTSGSSAPALEPVAWTSVVNCGVSGSSLQKITGQNDVDDAGAVSQQTIPSGDGYVEFAAPETATLRMAGLSHGSGGTGYAEIDFAVRLQSGVAEVMENGVYKAESAFAAGDVFRVSVEAGSVRYYRQGSLFYVSAMPPVYPLLMDTSLVNLGAAIANAKIMRTP
jgi:hypothetical protein